MARPGNPHMRKGAPSVNPQGRAAPIAKAATQPAGVDGVAAYGGFVSSGERNADLIGTRRWVTYNNALLKPIVATGIRYFTNLLSGTEWHADPNEAGGKDADRGVEVVTKGLLKAPLTKPWQQIVRKQALYRMLGNAIHATSMMRRKDGLVVFAQIEHRPQHTIERWLRDSEASPFDTVIQRGRETGREYPISLDECWYTVDDTISDSPDGIGLLRHIIEHVRRLEIYEALEGKAYNEDLGGIPIGRAPLAEIERAIGTAGKTADQIKTEKATRTQILRDVLDKRKKTPEQSQWLLLDSDVYANADQSKTNVAKWGLDIVKSETTNLPDINQVICRVRFEIACALGIEWVLLGSGDNGSFALSADKTSMFASTLQTTLTELAASATNQLARRLVAANGLDPDTATPTLVAEPISTDAIETCTRALSNLALAGLPPNDPARNVIRSRLRLPPEPDQAYDLVRPSRLIPAVGDPTVPPPGEAEVDPTKDTASVPTADPAKDPTGAQQIKPKKRKS